MDSPKTTKNVYQYVLISLTLMVLLFELISFCSTGWVRFEGSGASYDAGKKVRNRRSHVINPQGQHPATGSGKRPSPIPPSIDTNQFSQNSVKPPFPGSQPNVNSNGQTNTQSPAILVARITACLIRIKGNPPQTASSSGRKRRAMLPEAYGGNPNRNKTESNSPANRENLPGKQNQPFMPPQRPTRKTTANQRPTFVTNRPPFPPRRTRKPHPTSGTNIPPFPPRRTPKPHPTSGTNRPPFPQRRTLKPHPTSGTNRPPFPSRRTLKPHPTSGTNRPPFPSRRTLKPHPSSGTNRPPFPSRRTLKPHPTSGTNRPPFPSRRTLKPRPTSGTNRPPFPSRRTLQPRPTSGTKRPPFPSRRTLKPRPTSGTNRPPFPSRRTLKPRPTSGTNRPPFPSRRTLQPRRNPDTNRPPFPSRKPNWSNSPPQRPTENAIRIGTHQSLPTPIIKITLPTRKPNLPIPTKKMNITEFVSFINDNYKPSMSVKTTILYVVRVAKFWDLQMSNKTELKEAINKAEINNTNLTQVLYCFFTSTDYGSSNLVRKYPANSTGESKVPSISQTSNKPKQPWFLLPLKAISPPPLTNTSDTDAVLGNQRGQDEDAGIVSIDIGLWSAVVCEQVNVHDDVVCQQADFNDFMQGINAWSMTDVQVEAVFGVIFGAIGCISSVLLVLPSCLKNKKRLLLVFGICGLILSGLLYLISIARAVSLNERINEQIGPDYATFKMKSPWCLIVGGIGTGLAFVTSGMLVTQKWVDKRKEWSQFTDEVVFTNEINQPTDVAIKSNETKQSTA